MHDKGVAAHPFEKLPPQWHQLDKTRALPQERMFKVEAGQKGAVTTYDMHGSRGAANFSTGEKGRVCAVETNYSTEKGEPMRSKEQR